MANKYSEEKDILLKVLGVIEALYNKKISIEEAEKRYFNYRIIDSLKEKNYSDELIGILELGTEIDDINDLLPDKLDENIIDLKNRVLLLLDRKRNV
ncbi:DUF3969 family protein [Heyndrickxia coagulans]|uniref:DUF3969 family protein n=1 Tax=Heyndrickxia coagulans TaxID=1398 RepID=UPI0004047965|nr:DUF3969 family protein [Heyndrickxia coagulans]